MPKYFAYGSNLDIETMKLRCPSVEVLGPAVLSNYRLDFTIFSPLRNCGCADIVVSPNDEVWGTLYELSDNDMLAMDGYEGHPTKYHRVTLKVKFADQIVEAESYEVTHKQPFIFPSNDYLNIIKNAAQKYQFPPSYKEFLDKIKTVS